MLFGRSVGLAVVVTLLAGFAQWRPVPKENMKLVAQLRPAAAIATLSPLDPMRRDGPDVTPDQAMARTLNAAIPVSSLPVEAARPLQLLGARPQDMLQALDCLTMAIYYEAGFEPEQGRRAVAQVVLNRVRHPAFPKNVCGVVFQGSQSAVCQFSFTCDGSLTRAPQAAAWRRSREIAQEALDGYVEASVGHATHYHADYVAPYWRTSLIKIGQIGQHIFYRWPGRAGERGAFNARYAGLETAPPIGEVAPEVATDALAGYEPPPAHDPGGRVAPGLGWTPSIPMRASTGSALDSVLAEQHLRGGDDQRLFDPES